MGVPLKYAVVERERRFLLDAMPDGVTESRQITDRYVEGTRLRLREVRDPAGGITRKLTQKVRLTGDPSAVSCTTMYVNDSEWSVLAQMPARVLRKTRHIVARDGLTVAVDQLEDGTLLAEIDDGDRAPTPIPSWLPVTADVSGDECWTGGALAKVSPPE